MSRVSVFSLLSDSEKNMGAVNSKVKALTLELIKRAYHEGINVKITSGYRSAAEQNRLYAQGRTLPGPKVTNAKAGQSSHNYGYAVDYVLVSNDGRQAIWTVNKEWRRVAAIAKSLGFSWGGDWSSFPDAPHIYFGPSSWRELAAGAKVHVPNVPERNWIGPGDTGKRVEDLQRYLNEVGVPTDIDGFYGPGTEAAVKAFQKRRGIAVDGLYGPGSLDEMNKALKEGKPTTTPKAETAAERPKEEPKVSESQTVGKSLSPFWERAQDLGFTDGSNPNAEPTRAEAATMIVRALEPASQSAPGSLMNDWTLAQKLDITDGSNPNARATRAETAAMIVRAITSEEYLAYLAKRLGVEVQPEETEDEEA